MLDLNKEYGELSGLTIPQLMRMVEGQLESVGKNPGAWSYAKLAPDVDPVKWHADCLALSPKETPLWMVMRGDVDANGNFTQDKPLMCVTGNGETSESRAEFIVFCHNVMPSLYWLIDELLRERTKQTDEA